MKAELKKALGLGILASAFFAFTFILNRSINLGGGYWIWTASLRYFCTLPIMGLVVARKRRIGAVLDAIGRDKRRWLVWSTVGFGLFYAPLTCASVYGASWFVAATWQLTIVCGVLLTPLFGKKIPVKNIGCSLIIIAGVFLLQLKNMGESSQDGTQAFISLLLILLAAFMYPLGNRKMMSFTSELTTDERVFGMTLCSMPFWILLSVYALAVHGLPGAGQMVKSLTVALFSGTIATILFFEATNLVRQNAKDLAIVEATQSGEVLFTLIGGLLVLHDPLPNLAGAAGIVLIVMGMVLNSIS